MDKWIYAYMDVLQFWQIFLQLHMAPEGWTRPNPLKPAEINWLQRIQTHQPYGANQFCVNLGTREKGAQMVL